MEYLITTEWSDGRTSSYLTTDRLHADAFLAIRKLCRDMISVKLEAFNEPD